MAYFFSRMLLGIEASFSQSKRYWNEFVPYSIWFHSTRMLKLLAETSLLRTVDVNPSRELPFGVDVLPYSREFLPSGATSLMKYPIPACPAAHAVPALVLDVALSEVAEDSIDAPVLSAAVVDALYFFLSIPVQLSCSSYGSTKRRSVKASS